MRGFLAFGLAVALIAPSSAGAVTFSQASHAAGDPPRAVVLGDWDGVNGRDLATANIDAGAGDDSISIGLNQGGGTFGPLTSIETPLLDKPSAITSTDCDGDSDLDLAVTSASGDSVVIFENDGSGGFAQSGPPVATGDAPLAIASADFNGDPFADLAVANEADDTVTLLISDGACGYAPPLNFSSGLGGSPTGIATGDFNGDALQDAAVANSGTDTIGVLLGTGTGTFGPVTEFATSDAPRSLTTGDFFGDGTTALLAGLDSGIDGGVAALSGTGTGAFPDSTRTGIPSSFGTLGVTGSDFDGDGVLDLATTNVAMTYELAVLLGNGFGTFPSQQLFDLGACPCSFGVASADLSGDDRPDVVTTDSAGPAAIVLLNTTPFPSGTRSPASLTFGDQPRSTVSAVQTVTLTNSGQVPLRVRGWSTGGTDPSSFVVVDDNCTGVNLAVTGGNSSCAMGVRFAPASTGPRSASLSFNTATTAANAPSAVALTGTGVAAPGQIGPTGPAGPTGASGPKGDPGSAATVSVSCYLSTYRKLVRGQMVKRKRVICTVTQLPASGKVRAKLTKAGTLRATGSASARKGRAKIVLGAVKRGSYHLTLVTSGGTVKLAVTLR